MLILKLQLQKLFFRWKKSAKRSICKQIARQMIIISILNVWIQSLNMTF